MCGKVVFQVVKNSTVSSRKIYPETKALLRLLHVEGGLSLRRIVDKCKISRASVYQCLNGRNSQKNGNSRGRPRLITGRQQCVLERNVQKLHKEEGNFSWDRLRADSDLEHISLWTVNRTLKRMGYNLQEAHKKDILTPSDHQQQVQFARRVKRTYPADFFQRRICFFLNGMSFYYKRNLLNDSRAPQSKVWRKDILTFLNEGGGQRDGHLIMKISPICRLPLFLPSCFTVCALPLLIYLL